MGRRISIASAKAKGRSLQKWVCEKIANLLGVSWGYGDDCVIKPRPMGQTGVDVIIPDKYRKSLPFSIECKSGESWNIKQAIKQAKANQKKETAWLLFLKSRSMKIPIVIMDSELFFNIIDKIIRENRYHD